MGKVPSEGNVRLRVSSFLALVALAAFGSSSASAGGLYDNGGFSGETGTWLITENSITNSFFVNTSTVQGISFVSWLFPTDTLQTVDWVITSAPFGGTTYGSGTATVSESFLFQNSFDFNVNLESFAVPNIEL